MRRFAEDVFLMKLLEGYVTDRKSGRNTEKFLTY